MRAHRLRRRRCRRTRTRLMQEKVVPRHRAWIREVRMAAGSGKAKGRHQAPPSPPSCSLLRNRPMLAAGASNLSTSADPNLCARSSLLTSHTTTPSPCAATMAPVPATPRP
ncbi:hypothetical protein GQ55_2G230900 [Panicum hallii var. hallii]|uniref:Uncharacterized protein n=1 Tax=Panicum hallii var. hallii TaxID=1504633 RepID=A0A2T7ERI4_9POAL|nr:hypothetical protein GQ55_2G230900 [Panicum hallii var. hallii]